jgi:CheY-like chemotaxis protein
MIRNSSLIMTDYTAFVNQLHLILKNLNKPDLNPPDAILEFLGQEDLRGIRSLIISTIEHLKPADNLPKESDYWAFFEILQSRFVLGLTLEQTAERLDISVRNLQRMQKAAIAILAQELWKGVKQGKVEQSGTYQAVDWRTQSEIEIESLISTSNYEKSNVEEIVKSVFELKDVLFMLHGVQISTGFLQENLMADIHPSILKQILISALNQLSKIYKNSEIEIYALLEDGQVVVFLNGMIKISVGLREQDLLSQVFIPQYVQVNFIEEEDIFSLQIKIKPIGQRVVMVIEDNLDIIHFFKRATVGTPYHIVHISQPQNIFDLVNKGKPDVIVLDVMLPEIDGWKLLTYLHENLSTKSIPKIVCSVIKEGDLALALGASIFLSKPITHKQFVNALDQVFIQVSPG